MENTNKELDLAGKSIQLGEKFVKELISIDPDKELTKNEQIGTILSTMQCVCLKMYSLDMFELIKKIF